jgi:hypothetical protein
MLVDVGEGHGEETVADADFCGIRGSSEPQEARRFSQHPVVEPALEERALNPHGVRALQGYSIGEANQGVGGEGAKGPFPAAQGALEVGRPGAEGNQE